MVTGLVAIIVLLPLALNRVTPAPPEEEPAGANGTTDAGTGAAAPSSTADTTRVLVVRDSYTAGSPEGGQDEAGWPAVLDVLPRQVGQAADRWAASDRGVGPVMVVLV
jgi:hypothetical protein